MKRISLLKRPPGTPVGLRAKIVAWFLVPTIIILGAVAVLTFYAYRRVTEELVFERNRDRTQLLANQLGADLNQYAAPLSVLANTDGVYNALPFPRQDALETAWRTTEAQVFNAGVVILDDAGAIIASAPPELVNLERDLSDLAYDPQMAGQVEISNLMRISTATLPPMDVIALSWPIQDPQGNQQGTMVGLFRAERQATRTSTFYRNIWDLYIGRREVAYVVDGNGRIIFHPDTFLIGEDIAARQAVRQGLNSQAGALRSRNQGGQDVVAGFAPVPGTPWILITEESWADLLAPSLPYTRFLLILLALGVGVPVAVVALGVRRITTPLLRLTRAAKQIAQGNFDQTIEVHTGDELETLAEQFNTMARQLQDSYANLEQRVTARTRELETLNAVSAVVSRSLDLDQVMQAALEKTLAVLDVEAGAAFRLGDDKTLHLMAHQGLSDAFIQRVERLPLEESIAAQAIAQAAPTLRAVTEYVNGALKTQLQREGLQTVICVPLTAKGDILGTLNLATHAPRPLSPQERSLLSAIGQQTGVAVENARLYEQAEAAAAEAERIRLARELHDAVSQTLFSASLIADVLPRLWERDPEEGRRRLAALSRLTRGAMAEMRTLLLELRPSALLKTAFNDLLQQLTEAMAGRAQIEIALDVHAIPPLPPDVKVTLYRIAQEALTNVIKHAQADHVWLSLTPAHQAIELRIRDDGRGFDISAVPNDHFGLQNMRERADAVGAELTIESQPGHGTQITITWRKEDE